MSFKTKKWKIFTLIHLENEAIILLFVQQKPKHDQVAFCSGVGVNAFFLVSILNWMLLEALSNAFHETFPNTVHVQVCSSQEITSWPNYMLSMCHRHFRRVYLFLLGYMMPRMFSMESHSPWFSTFVCWAWTTTHKVHHKQEVNKIVKEHASLRKHECPEFQRKLHSLVTLSLKWRYL